MSKEFDYLKIYDNKLTDKDFKQIAEFVQTNYGIKMPPVKKAMVQNRLYRRLRACKISTFDQYVKYVFSEKGKSELNEMINAITTNKTDFYREKEHFDILQNLLKDYKEVKIWSAACSSGEEVYTIALTMEKLKVKYFIYGSDLSDNVLKKAEEGIYNEKLVEFVPYDLLNKYFVKIEKDNRTYYKVKEIIKDKVKFLKINLLDKRYPLDKNFDVIFLRNVLIYFDRNTQEKVLRHVLEHLKTGGYLFLGHSEAIFDMDLPIYRINKAVYQKN